VLDGANDGAHCADHARRLFDRGARSPIEIHGNTAGLAPAAIKALERIYRRRAPSTNITSPELTRSLVEASAETGRQVGALVHRSGQVDFVVVGDAGKLFLPDIGRFRAAEGRLRGLRLVHTHLRGEGLTRDDLVDLVRLRLDMVAAIQIAHDGEPRNIVYAHLVPTTVENEVPYREVGPVPMAHLDVDVANLVDNLEAEFAKRSRARSVRAKDGRAILIHVAKRGKGTNDADESMRELRELARTAGVEVVDAIIQFRDAIDAKFVMGKGKLDDVIIRAMQLDAEVLIFDRDLSPAQAASIAGVSDLKVIDRSQLILDIFAQRAESRDGKLQVELAQLKYAMPRLGQKDDSLSRLTGGIGGRGPGETKIEIGKRRAKDRLTHLESQLRNLGKQREQRRRRRARRDVPSVAIVGYTNAGKSTLLNTFTGAHVFAEDKLFATLETRTRTLYLLSDEENGTGESLVLTDTVGFIRRLPKDLFAAFRATFEEAADADLLLHVLDASDDALEVHMKTTQELLKELELDGIERWIVLNKADRCEPERLAALERAHEGAIVIHASEASGIVPLRERLVQWSREHRAKERAEPRDDDDAVSDETHTESLVPAFEMPEERPWPATVFDDV
jgi:GTP-binding protein HflX